MLKIDAFNVLPGTVLNWSEQGHAHQFAVVTSVRRDPDTEKVFLRFRGDRTGFEGTELDYSEQVEVIGLSVNPNDPDDTNFGTDEEHLATDHVLT